MLYVAFLSSRNPKFSQESMALDPTRWFVFIYLAEVFHPAILSHELANFARKLKGCDGFRRREIGAKSI